MLEVWDVVDKASKRKVSDSLTLANANRDDAESGRHTFLDATVVDVYHGCHAAIFLIDPSKKWTYEYVQRELATVPEHIPTCVVLNFRDYPASKRLIRLEEVEADMEYSFGKRPFRPFVMEASLLNCYGLQALSTFLHIPFLCLKRASLEQAMQLNTHAIVQAQEAMKTVRGNSYDAYERKIDAATGGEGKTGTTQGRGATRRRRSDASVSPAGPREAAITWEKLSKTALGEAPVLLGSAAVGGILSGVSAVAATAADIAENVKSLASLKTLGLGPAEKKGTFVDEPENASRLNFRISPVAAAPRAAFGGVDDDDEDRPRANDRANTAARDRARGCEAAGNTRTSPRTSATTRRIFRRRYPEGARASDSGPFRDDGRSSNDERERRRWTARVFERRLRIRRRPRLRARLGRQRRRGRFGVGVEGGDCSLGRRRREATTRARGRRRDERRSHESAFDARRGAADQRGGSVLRRARAAASESKNVEVIRAAEMDLDPSAIAASFGSPGDAADAYETVKDPAGRCSPPPSPWRRRAARPGG